MQYQYSHLAFNALQPSAVNQLTTDFAANFRENTDINLGVGYVNDKTIPAEAIAEAYRAVIVNPLKYRNSLNYGGSEGSVNLRNAIRNYYLENKTGQLTETDFSEHKILIGANGATSILDSLSDLFERGVVITADPFYYIYTETLERKGFTIAAVPEDEQGIIPEKILQTISKYGEDSIRFFYIVTVNNPTTVVLSNERRKQIVEIAHSIYVKTGRKIPVIFDKAYEDIIHDPKIESPVSGLKFDRQQLVCEVGTLSKILAPGLRIGYIICPDNELAQLISQRTSDIGFSAPLINQEIASWLLENYIERQKKEVNAGYRTKALNIKNLFAKYLTPYLEGYSGGSAAFYFYLTFTNIRTDNNSPFHQYLSRKTGISTIDGYPELNPRLVYIPGTICSKGPKACFQLRLSYGFEDAATFEKAILLIREACQFSISHEK